MRSEARLLNLDNGQQVMIALHLYKKCFSVRHATTRRVLGYTERIVVRNVSFPIFASGRLRVLRERQKNVHAFVRGIYDEELQEMKIGKYREAYYNPYEVSAFVDRESLEVIGRADIVLCEEGKVYYWKSGLA
ncbi:hypothetical protein NST69_32480 [Paenibacillus sp. FSL P2-0089]|uniref:hypothetical protein n=1 Tax=Paenibacillus sp. FSL P2-0089 TaxID=2954526 RepID=UPI00315ACA95